MSYPMTLLQGFMPGCQWRELSEEIRRDDRRAVEMAFRIRVMPGIGESPMVCSDAPARLRYTDGGRDCFLTALDSVRMIGIGACDGEAGLFAIGDLIGAGFELDLNFNALPMSETLGGIHMEASSWR